MNSDIKLDVPKPPDWMRYVNNGELNMLTNTEPIKDRTSIMVAPPPFWRLTLADNPKHFIGFVVWEGSSVPDYWIPYMADKRVDQIWVPSKHTEQAIKNTITTTSKMIWDKIKIVPHGVDLNTFKPSPPPKGIPKDKFTFVCNKGWRGHMWDRGGVQFVIKAFCDEFAREEQVQLLLKLNPGYLPQGFNFNNALQNLNPKNHPVIQVNADLIPFNLLYQLYAMSHVYVSAQMADAFNLPGMEAMACRLPTIQTNYGGQTDYMTIQNSWAISYKLENVQQDAMYEECKWAKPDINHLKKIMRYCFEHPEEVKQKGKQALEDAKKWTWHNSAKKAIKFLKELE